MPDPQIRYTQEGGGTVATCTCGWLRWELEPGKIRKVSTAHKCPAKKT